MAFNNQLKSLSKQTAPPSETNTIVDLDQQIINNQTSLETQPVERRSADYKPSIWKHDFIKSLKNDYSGEEYVKRAEELKIKIKHKMDSLSLDKKDPLALLHFIDDIQRLGLGYIFEKDILQTLSFLQENNKLKENTLHATALNFRLFRQHGLNVSQDVFNAFKDPRGNFLEYLSEDIVGLLSLYESCYFGIEGEDVLDEAKVFARKHLMNVKDNIDPNLAELVNHALNLPLNLSFTRLESKWYIGAYSRREDVDSSLLELTKLDFNIVQGAHQKDLIDLSRWWENLGLPKALPFARNRLVECLLWSVGAACEPQYSYVRKGITKIVQLITVIDDVYDVYATYDEAKLFTEAVERWEISAMETLPDYMKLLFLALHNTINDFAYNTLKEQGWDIITYLKKTWVVQCKCYLLESKWFHTGYKPTLEEYLENSCVSCGVPLSLFHIYFFLRTKITKEVLEYIESYPKLIHWSSMIMRLTDDMGTSKAELIRGDVPKSIQCYMYDKGVTEEVAREYIRYLLDESWKKLNAEVLVDSPLPKEFIKIVLDLGRAAETVYQHDDGYGIPDKKTKNRVLSLLVDNIPVVCHSI